MNDDQLDYLMGCYFHEDFDETGGLWGTLDLYFTEVNIETVRALVVDLEAFLVRVDDAEIRRELREMGCAVHMQDPAGYRSWLTEVATRSRDHLASVARA